jgi:7,8-dihydropterin-6-yl-methyl-4-(beta-D-ribofuranosyl)aminobenzene 5'-phosphate synthase
MKRRDFLKQMAVGGAALGVGNSLFGSSAMAALIVENGDFGVCRKVRIKCITEQGFSTQKGPKHRVNGSEWYGKAGGGFSALITLEGLEGQRHQFLFDAGSGFRFTDRFFRREKVDQLMKKGTLSTVILSHDHGPNAFGVQALLGYNPDFELIVPNGFDEDMLTSITRCNNPRTCPVGTPPHSGKLIKTAEGKTTKLFEGCAAVNFALESGGFEQSLYFNVKGKGIVCVTGSCHQGITALGDYALDNFRTDGSLYGFYGGLNLSDNDELLPGAADMLIDMGRFNFRKIAANGDTGLAGVQMMNDFNLSVVKGSGRFGSGSNQYVGNGDIVVF